MTFALTFSASDLLYLLPELFLTLWLCVVLAVDFSLKRIVQEQLAYLSVLGLAVALGILAWFDASGITGTLFGKMFVLDRLAIFFKMMILLATILVILLSVDYVHRFSFFRGEYYVLVTMSALGMMFMSSANDLLSLFVTLEFSTFGFYVLVAYLRDDMASNEAGLKFFILGVFAAGLLAYGISLVFGETGKLVFSDMTGAAPTTGLVIGFLLIFAALGFKIGAVPFHSWIPDTYHGSPTPVTAFLSIAPKVAAFAILLRLFLVALPTFKPAWALLLVAASILSMTYGNIVAIAQRNIKRLLAYSGIAQVGNVLIGLAAGTKMGTDSILFYLLTYLFANLGAFAVIMAISNAVGSEEIEDYSGLNRRSPFLAFAMLIFLLSLAGVPPLAGFIGKLYIFVAAIKEGLYTLITVGLINIVISMYYYLIVVKKMYISEPLDASPIKTTGPLRAVVYIGLAGTLVIGIYPQPFIDWVVAATLMFSNLVGSSAALPPSGLPFGG
ncbi:NADH-quinone oxidoreductase subunit N [Nitrospirales bacterium NOB]|nr:NADH-quinone oxidoreductase subunit N [Nitrospirota bacterium]MDL1890575.1 NADH-quinone oxidoreductase subunit N [Nitrospirales bacterium NOB]MEB2338137.1 NADH-quinone oxidoreductase subunit N [Nitrospirales bacterium]QOJ35310.1 MAG: NADH-quinone oxidoreductase subunit N [Nitrospira sp.]